MLVEFASVPFAGYAVTTSSAVVSTAPGSITGGTYVNEGVSGA